MKTKEELVKIGYSTNINRFFGRLVEMEVNLKLAMLYRKDFKHSTHEILKKGLEDLSKEISPLIEAYSGLYGPPTLEVSNISTIEPYDYIKKMYDAVLESKAYFKESWIHHSIDQIAKILAILLYKIIYLK